ncbi:MAG: prepilin-type N-terminal cleavage/methylation domain-containing protein [Bdellovibrionaceae bacterium]|nr:prepilin-type N-terminal cleavage/methylation domain-containing protein [Pseudobdellovibrionaceae bacterium]
MSDQKGFTLIEVLITVAILGMMTILATQSIQQAIKSKVKIQDQIDDVSRMRDALRLIESDVNQAFHYRDVEKEISDLLKKKSAPANQQLPNQDAFTPPPEAPRVDPTTHFMGSNERMDFVTMNNARMVRNMKQADFIEIGYSSKSCKSLTGEMGSSQCLWRRSTTWVDEDVTKGGDEVVLLENVSEFKLRFIGKGKDDWVTDWRSDTGGDAVTRNNFPSAVEVSLTVERKDPKTSKIKKYSMQIVAQIRFPNNEEAKDANANSGSIKTTQ